MAETPFKGSVLETEIRNNATKKQLELIEFAAARQPDSQFWKEALAMAKKKQLKNK